MRGGSGLAAALIALLTLSAPAASLLTADTPEPTRLDEASDAWPGSFEGWLAWSTTHQDELIAPLLPGVATLGYAEDALAAYRDGQAWATETLISSDRADLERGLTRLLVRLDAPSAPLALDRVPDGYVAPMAALVQAQASTPYDDVIVPDPSVDPVGFNRLITLRGAWVTGVISTVQPALEAASQASEVGAEPVFVDPVGLVILGGEGDNTYTIPEDDPGNDAPALIIEPGGNDTYLVHVASPGEQYVHTPVGPNVGAERILPPMPIAIEQAGNDTYTQRAASENGILIDQAGDDAYGNTDRRNRVTHASTGSFVYLNDEQGNDTYETKERGLAYASLGTAIHVDQAGNDAYTADTGRTDGFTHAAGEDIGALAVLRDYAGDDVYVSDGAGLGFSEDDASTLFIDDEGDDDYYADFIGTVTFGQKTIEEGGFWAPTTRTPAYFLDGDGQDTYEYRALGSGHTDDFGNDLTRIRSEPAHRWSIFVDCQTPADADYPCPDEQRNVTRTILDTA